MLGYPRLSTATAASLLWCAALAVIVVQFRGRLIPTSLFRDEPWVWLALIGLSSASLAIAAGVLVQARRQRGDFKELRERLDKFEHSVAHQGAEIKSHIDSHPADGNDPAGRIAVCESEIAGLEETLKALQAKLADIEKGQAGWSAGLQALERSHEELAASLAGHARTAQAKTEELRGLLQAKSIEAYFEEWKARHLSASRKEETDAVFREFTNSPENRKSLADNRETQQKILEKARIWFAGLDGCVNELSGAADGDDGFLAAFRPAYTEYCRRGRELIARLEESIPKFDLSTVPADPGAGLSFVDVVSGRSAEILSLGYRRRLADRLEELAATAAACQQEWDALRVSLLELLDQFYGQYDARAAAGAAAALQQVEQSLRAALKAARVYEVPIEVNATAYDPSVHEPLAGASFTRPDLPENTVVRLERRGFLYEGKIFRRALVTLSSKGKP
jgi:hypothetical protein